jgi:alkaline phosphatase
MNVNRPALKPLAAGLFAGGLLVAAHGLLAQVTPGSGPPKPAVARSVIFINGDGMGTGHRETARLFLAGFDGQLVMDRLAVSGQLTTSPRDAATVVSDSAAGASAWATGQRTYNGAISVDVAGNPLSTLGAEAKASGRATGLVTTAQVTDATPAAFFANARDRSAQSALARQYLEVTRPDVILGGGEDWWLPAGEPGVHPDQPPSDPTEGSAGTEGDLIRHAVDAGYQYVSSPAGLSRADGRKLLGLFANEEMFEARPEGQGDRYEPAVSLATMTRKALDVVGRDPDGFFLVVEEEGVDEFAHRNNATRMLQSMAALEQAVTVARAYVAQHPDTLLIVTGDHETGGLAVEDPWDDDESGDGVSAEDGPFPIRGSELVFAVDWTTGHHTGADIPVTAEGPGAGRFTGKHPNTHVYDVLSGVFRRR